MDTLNVSKSSSEQKDSQVGSQVGANGMSPALLLGRRENLTTSLENLTSDAETKADSEMQESVFLNQLQMQQRHLREQTDKQLTSCIREDPEAENYLYHPPISKVRLTFNNPRLENDYHMHYTSSNESLITFASPRISAMFDMLVSAIFLTLISICCFVSFDVTVPWVVIFVLVITVEILVMLPLLYNAYLIKGEVTSLGRFTLGIVGWYPRHLMGALVVSLPVLCVFASFSCQMFSSKQYCDLFYCVLLVASLLHYCNFSLLSSWMKSILAFVSGTVLLILVGLAVCRQDTTMDMAPLLSNNTGGVEYNITQNFNLTSDYSVIFSGGVQKLMYEIILNIALLLLLIWFLNREFEISYRLSFHGNVQALRDKQKMEFEKEQADWLLHNIIPEHVADVLKKTSKYCQNHKDVGVIFAKVCNFDDFYDESFEGGKEYLRVLNELMGDFEELFDVPKYKDIEKIKTIGSCLMAACGLNPQIRSQNKNPKAHLYALMDFALGILKKLDQFNSEIFNFNFEMQIGYNFGEVTAGVIGTTKLLYDIWGDTVNISSRMYSTGEKGKIQVTEDVAKALGDVFEFEHRGTIFVKGKGDMNTFRLVGQKPGTSWD